MPGEPSFFFPIRSLASFLYEFQVTLEALLTCGTGAGVPLTSPQLYSAGHTDDLRTALVFISRLYPKAPLLGVGFSLGANVLTRYLAQEGDKSRLLAGCALGCVRTSPY